MPEAILEKRTEAGLKASSIMFALIGFAALGVQPILVSVLIELGNFSHSSAGYIASAEVFGVATANVAITLMGNRWNWKHQCTVGLLLIVVSNLASITWGSDSGLMMLSRFTSGLGCGLLISRGYAAAALSQNPDGIFGYILAASTAQMTAASYLLPKWSSAAGMDVIFYYFLVLAVIGFFFLRWMPAGEVTSELQKKGRQLSFAEPALALTSAAMLFLGLGVMWPYLLHIGISTGISSEAAAIGLSASMIAAFFGALIAGVGVRWVPAGSILIATLIITVASVVLFQTATTSLDYGLFASGFNGGSNAAMALVLGAVAATDSSGRLTAAAVTLQTLGFALGPALAAAVVGDGNYHVAQLLSATFVLVSLLTAVPVMLLRRKRQSATAWADIPVPEPRCTKLPLESISSVIER